jgi:signal transduction histidine kinase
MVRSVAVVNNHITGDILPQAYGPWAIFFLMSLIYSSVTSWRKTLHSQGLERNQFLAVTFGVTSFLVPTLLTNTVLPLFNEYRLNNVGPIFTIFLIAFVAHAIIEYRFLEIRLVIKRSFDFIFLWGFSFLLIIAFYLFLGRLVTVTVVHGIAAFAIAICFGPVARFIDALTVRLTSRGTYIFDQAVARISEVAHASIDLHELQSAVVDRVAEYFGYANIAFVTFPPHTPTQPLKAVVRGYAKDVVKGLVSAHGFCVARPGLVLEATELQWRLNNDVEAGRADWDREVLAFMRSRGIDAMISFAVGPDVIGLMFLSGKRDGAVLTDRDLALFAIIRGTVAPALANAVRYAQMEKMYTELAALDKAKSDFIGVVSHQFRTPLTAILWNAELALEDAKAPAETRGAFEQIYQRASFLNVTLNRIFSLLALENKQITFKNERLDVAELVKESLKSFKAMCADKKLRVTTECDSVTVMGDREKLASVVYIVIENACQFSKVGGQVRIGLHRAPAGSKMVLTIVDEGIGIPPAELAEVFEKFRRGSNAQKAVADGAGVSLYLAKKFVEKHKGTIELSSVLNQGTTVTITLPTAPSV